MTLNHRSGGSNPSGATITMDVETKRMIEGARFIARFAGVKNERVEQMERCACQISKSISTKVFQTPAMVIVAGDDTLELSITRRENDKVYQSFATAR